MNALYFLTLVVDLFKDLKALGLGFGREDMGTFSSVREASIGSKDEEDDVDGFEEPSEVQLRLPTR